MKQVLISLVPFLLCSIAVAQTRSVGGSLPTDLRPSLQDRLSLFTQAQADGRWDEVELLLGKYRRGGTGNHLYTATHKQCLISQMQSHPLIAFTFSFEKVLHSTEILSMPASSRWWYLAGEGKFRTQSGETKQETQVVAYRDNGQWYFTPPNYDQSWEKAHITEADFLIDRANEVDVKNNPKSPIEIRDVHVFMQRTYPSLRDVKFTLQNRTGKKVKGFTVRLYDRDGSVTYTAGHEIEPNASLEEKMDSSAYAYFCDGIKKQHLMVERVFFADGSQWPQ